MHQYRISSLVLSIYSFVLLVYSVWKIYFVQIYHPETKLPKEHRGILNLNFVSGFIHIASALTLSWLTSGEEIVWEAPAQYTTNYWVNATNETCQDSGKCYLQATSHSISDIPVALIAVLFGIISGTSHLLLAAYGESKTALDYAERGHNPIRWIEYSLSSSLMIFIIGVLCGVSDIFVLSTTTLFQAYLMFNSIYIERDLAKSFLNGLPVSSTPFWSASLFYCFGVWFPIIFLFYTALDNSPNEAPDWVNAIVWILFFLFALFAIVMWYYLIYKASDVTLSTELKKIHLVKQELAYVTLSLTAKVVLHWTLYTGITARSGKQNVQILRPNIYLYYLLYRCSFFNKTRRAGRYTATPVRNG